jgi:hypothetical protein
LLTPKESITSEMVKLFTLSFSFANTRFLSL